ncbi:hypothetical protein DQ393_30860 [Rhizobium tropici]|uniref:Uncharacterized protein n=1 Tax=Rhizobium tropici TaxID=398 RepID=A0A329Y127_RHITR|nr:hypothetical protein DQ393_30860 [Rhizobium tropici]
MVTIRCAMDTQFSGFEISAPKIDVAWTALQRQYANHLTGAEIDHLFVGRAPVGTELPSNRPHIAFIPFPSRYSHRSSG